MTSTFARVRDEIDLTVEPLPDALDPIASGLRAATAGWVAHGATHVAIDHRGRRYELAGASCDHDSPASMVLDPDEPETALVVCGLTATGLHDVELTTALLGRLLRQTLESQHAIDEVIEIEEQAFALRELASAAPHSLDSEQLADELAADAVRLTGAVAAVVALPGVATAAAGAHARRPALVELATQRGHDAAIDLGQDVTEPQPDLMVVPLGGVDGVLAAAGPSDRALRERERDLIEAFAHHAGSLLHLAQLHAQVQAESTAASHADAASVLVDQATPTWTPRLAGIRVAGHRRPTGLGRGGYYSYTTAADSLVFCAGRVSGGGLDAALVIREIERTTAATVHRDPSATSTDILAAVRTATAPLLAGYAGEASVVIGRWHTGGTTLDVAIAGAPTVVTRHQGATSTLASVAPPLGRARPDAEDQRSLPFEPGDALLLGSDLLPEQPSADGQPLGRESLCAILDSTTTADASELLDRLLAVQDRHGAGRPSDDDRATLVVTRPHVGP